MVVWLQFTPHIFNGIQVRLCAGQSITFTLVLEEKKTIQTEFVADCLRVLRFLRLDKWKRMDGSWLLAFSCDSCVKRYVLIILNAECVLSAVLHNSTS